MTFLANYWWLLVLPIAILLWIASVRRTPRSRWIWLLRFGGIMLLLAPAVWLVTGNVQTEQVSIQMDARGAVFAAVAGLAALVGAHVLAARSGPPA